MVDEFHLEILRGSDLMGRWYLADVEVTREIAERFTLFLGDDEMEFLADDALVFAYEGVTRMQEGWVKAKKRRRRHRRAADDAARRKDEAPPEPAPVAPRAPEPTTKPKRVATSELAKKLAAIAEAESRAEAEKRRLSWAEAEAEAIELGANAEAAPLPPVEASPPPTETRPRPARKPRKPKPPPEPVEVIHSEPVEPFHTQPVEAKESEPVEAAPLVHTPAPSPEDSPQPEYPEPSWIAPPPARMVTVDLSVPDPVVTETRFPPEEVPEPSAEPAEEAGQEAEPAEGAEDELTKRRQRRSSRRQVELTEQPEEPSAEEVGASQVTDIDAARVKVKEPRGSGHHPAETNVGLLAKLRRPPKADQEHVHTYQESRSSGGLTRRVCLECNHVSITSDD